jgi:ABC-2 type transport system ATP-binding protein
VLYIGCSSAEPPRLDQLTSPPVSRSDLQRVAGGGDAAEDAPKPLLEATGVVKRYGGRVALGGVSVEASAGEMVACIGPNGAGKTTLLTILAGIQRPDAGRIDRRTARIGWVPQQPALYGKLSVAENLRLFARLERVPDIAAAVAGMLEQTGLRERADDQVSQLSVGNRQRVNIAIGLLSSPQVLLLDEPTAALDSRQRERLWEFICALAAAGTGILYATHNVLEAERYAGRVLVLADGERLFWGEPAELGEAVEGYGGGEGPGGFEAAFVSFLRQHGH